uniref:Uncharacterized protein n=1 Tax=Oryza punctata TaxID=4537 RepID=A0A0E0KFY8_ORYPU
MAELTGSPAMAVSATARVLKFSKDEEIKLGGNHSAQAILQIAKDDEFKLGGRWKSLGTSAASKIQEVIPGQNHKTPES